MGLRRMYVDPNSVLKQPWLWREISRDLAELRVRFFPVVQVSHGPMGRQATLMSHPALNGSAGAHAGNTTTTFHVKAKLSAETMSLSPAGAKFIQGWELLRLTVYDATPPTKDMTIGWGHKLHGSENYTAINRAKADELFNKDAAMMAAHVNKDLKVKVPQNQFDALVSLRFNAGQNNTTPPVTALNLHGHASEDDFTKHYIKSGGKFTPGLALRRAREWQIFDKGVYDSKH